MPGEGEGEVEVDGVVRTTGALECVAVVVALVVVFFLVEGCDGGRLSMYWSAAGTPVGVVVIDGEIVGVVAVVVVVVVAEVVDADDVAVEVAGVESAVAPGAGSAKPIVATSRPRASR